MAALPPVRGPPPQFRNPPPQFRYPPPQFLNLQRPGFYVDENQRFWMVHTLFFTPALYPLHSTLLRLGTSTVIFLWQMTPTWGFPPFLLSLTGLPRMWRREAWNFYRGSDGSLWELQEHIQTGVIELLVLKMDGYVGTE